MADKTTAKLNIQLRASSAILRKEFARAAAAMNALAAALTDSSALTAFIDRVTAAEAFLGAMAATAGIAWHPRHRHRDSLSMVDRRTLSRKRYAIFAHRRQRRLTMFERLRIQRWN